MDCGIHIPKTSFLLEFYAPDVFVSNNNSTNLLKYVQSWQGKAYVHWVKSSREKDVTKKWTSITSVSFHLFN